MRSKTLGGLALALAALLAASACGGSGGTGSGTSSSLTIEDNPLSPMTDTFNPFSATDTVRTVNATSLIYEPLLQYNIMKPTEAPRPWLATSYDWSNSGTTLTFHLRSGVKWSNGTPFTASDVAFTFDLIMKNKAANQYGLPITGASAPDSSTAVVNFSSPQYANLYRIAGSTWMVPKSVWQSIGNPTTYTDAKPIGTGPYTLETFSPQGFTLVRNNSYWGGKPAISTVNFPSYSSNTTANQALSSGEIDWAGNDVNQIQQTYVDKDPTHNHYWFPAINTVSLVLNVTKAPFNDVTVRRAVSAAIDRGQLSKQGETGYEQPATSSSGMVLPLDSSLVPSTMVNDLSSGPQLSKVDSLMTAGGYTRQGGYWTKNGQPVSFTIEDPSTFTDYYTDDSLLQSQLKTAGFKVTINGTSENAWQNDMAQGSFDATIYWGQAGPSPFYQYQSWMDDSAAAPIGQQAAGDYGRFNSAAAQAAISQYESSASTQVQDNALLALATIESQQVPTIPLVYGAAWYEYSTKKFTNWPTATNEYNAPLPNDPMIEYTVLHLKAAS